MRKKAKVGNATYSIKVNTQTGKFGYDGLTDNNEHTIYIDKNLERDYFIETLIHELLHAVNHQAGLKDDEQTVQITANLLTQALLSLKIIGE